MMQRMKKIWLFLVMVCLLLCLLAFGVCAEESGAESGPVWTVTPDAEIVSNGERTWQYYWLPDNVVCAPEYYYELGDDWLNAKDVDISMGYPYGLSADGGDIIWTGSGTSIYVNGIYVTPKGKRALDFWQNGVSENYRLRDRDTGHYAYYDDGLVEEMGWLPATYTADVRDLQTMPCYEVYIFDETDTFGYPTGAIYDIGGVLYYVCYAELDNSHFDANGEFSYRRGTIRLARLSGAQAELTRGAVDGLARFVSINASEKPYVPDDPLADVNMTVFWVVYTLLFVLAPLPFVVVGMVFANSKKRGYPTYYYSVVAIAGGWMLVGSALAALLSLI